MTGDDQWVSWEGGPHIVLPAQALHKWEGGDPPSGGRVVHAISRYGHDGVATDYDRACDVSELVGSIPVGDCTGLVLGDEVPMSTLTQSPDGSLVIFVPMTWERDDAYPISKLPTIVHSVAGRFADTGVRFVHPGGQVTLQPAVFSGNDATSHCRRIARSLASGEYRVWTADTETEGSEFRAHWLRAV